MVFLTGTIVLGVGNFRPLMTRFADRFRAATGQNLYPGTLNVNIGDPISIREHFRIPGVDLGDDEQDFLFEVCRVNDFWAYRIRPFHRVSGQGGHGDHVLEIVSAHKLPRAHPGATVEIALFR